MTPNAGKRQAGRRLLFLSPMRRLSPIFLGSVELFGFEPAVKSRRRKPCSKSSGASKSAVFALPQSAVAKVLGVDQAYCAAIRPALAGIPIPPTPRSPRPEA